MPDAASVRKQSPPTLVNGKRLVNHPFGGGPEALDAGRVSEQRRRYWSKLIAEQEASEQKARPFCRERGIGEWSFYRWRRRLREADTVEFALLETAPAAVGIPDSALELVLRNGERVTHRQRRGRGHPPPGAGCGTAMMHLPASVRGYLCLSPCDMCRSFDGLHALVRDHLQLDPFAGHLYSFANRRRDRLKILYWDRNGFAIWAKRLEAGNYAIPSGEPYSTRFEITVEELGALLSGIDLSSTVRRQRYRRAIA
jgi:hypothetical protein